MFQSALVVLSVILIGYILYKVVPLVINKYYVPKSAEKFQNRPAPVSAPAPSIGLVLPELPRVVSPGGPNPPNVAPPPPLPAPLERKIPDERASDPMAETNAEVPMKDNMRHPERMFAPAIANKGTQQGVEAGTAGESSVGKFTNDSLQNGGEFMKGVFAHDMVSSGENFAEF